MSPEQIEGKPADERSDFWAFGAILFEMLTGRTPFQGTSIPGVIAAVLREDPTPVSRARAGVPTGFDSIVARCLEKDPSRRFACIEEIRAALEAMEGGDDSRTSIAVLPFANLSADKENEYFGDGLAEEIINALTQVAGLRVIARTSAFVFRDKQEDVRRIAQQLGVANVLQGSVRKAGNRIRVTAQLITAADATQVWSSRYDREMIDVFAVQDEIAQSVVDALRERLGATVATQLVQRQIADIEAYHLYIKGRHHFYKLEPADMDTGRRLLMEALAVDPNYALPWVDLAHYYWVNAMTGRISPGEATTNGIHAAEQALMLDHNLGEAVGFRGRFSALYEYRWPEALRDLERALELNPASALTPQGYAVVLTALNRLEDAVRQHERAVKADPFSVLNQYFMARLMVYVGDFENARRHSALAVELSPESWLANSAVGLVHLRSGRVREALASLERTKGVAPGRFITSGWRGCAHALAGQTEEAEHLARELTEMHAGVSAAMVYAQLGKKDAVFDLLEMAVRERDFQLYNLQVDPLFESLRKEPRYHQLLRFMRLES
jgi:serine/threonine-protein kinase